VSEPSPSAAQHRPQSISHGAIVVTAAAGVFVASGYIVNVWLGRLLGPDDYGRFGVVISLLTVLNVIQNAAIPQAVARTTAEAPEMAEGTLRRGVELQMAMAVLMTAALMVAAPVIAGILGDGSLVGLIRLAALALPGYGLFTLLMAYHNGRRHYTRQAATQAAYAIAKALGAIGLAYAYRLGGAISGYVIAAVVGVIAGWHRFSAPRSPVPYRRLIGFAGPLSVYAIASIGQMSVDIFFVKAVTSNPDIAGYYAASQNVARIPYYLMTGLAAIILPAIAAAARRGNEAAATTAASALRWALILVVPSTAIILSTSTPLIELLYSTEYRPGGELLVLLAPAMGALALSSIVAGVLSGLGRPGASAMLAGIGLAVTVVACVVLIPAHGAPGAALATLIGTSVALVGSAALLWRLAHGSLPFASALRVAGAAAVVAAIGWGLSPTGAGLMAAYAGLAVLGLAILLVTREMTLEELNGMLRRGRSSSVSD
jgi:stage V sporulation protein B